MTTKIKVGDYYLSKYGTLEIFEIQDDLVKMGYCNTEDASAWFSISYVDSSHVPKEIYNSPLFKALQEEE